MAGKKDVSFTISATETARAVIKTVEDAFSALWDKVTSLPTVIGAALAGAGLGELFKGVIEAAAGAETALARLSTAIGNAGGDFASVKPAVDATIASLAKTTTFKETELVAGLEQLVVVSGNVQGSMGAMGLVTDIARQRHVDLATAATLVGRVMDGNTTMLKRYGIVLKDGVDAMQQLQEKFGGFAANEATTFQGQLERVSQGWERFQIALGNAIIGTDAGKTATSALVGGLANLEAWVTANEDKIGQLTLSVVNAAQAIGSALVTAIKNAGPALDVLAGDFIWLKEKMDDASGDTNVQRLREALQAVAQAGFANVGGGTVAAGAKGFESVSQRVLSTTPGSDASETAIRNLSAAVKELDGIELDHLKHALDGFVLQKTAAGQWSDDAAKNYGKVITAINAEIAARAAKPAAAAAPNIPLPGQGESAKDKAALETLTKEIDAFAAAQMNAGDKGAQLATRVEALTQKILESKMPAEQQRAEIEKLDAAYAHALDAEAVKVYGEAMKAALELTGTEVDKLGAKYDSVIETLEKARTQQVDPAEANKIQAVIDQLEAAKPAAVAFAAALEQSRDALAALSERIRDDRNNFAALEADIGKVQAQVITWTAKVAASTVGTVQHKQAVEELTKALNLLRGAEDTLQKDFLSDVDRIGKELDEQHAALEANVLDWTQLASAVIAAADTLGVFGKQVAQMLQGVTSLADGATRLFAAMNSTQGFAAGGGFGAIASITSSLASIGASIEQTSQENAAAAAQFKVAVAQWQASFQALIDSLTGTNFQKAQDSLDQQFTNLANRAIDAAATAIKSQPAATFGATGVGLFGSRFGPVPAEIATVAELDAYIVQLKAEQGTGKNVAQDRDLATLLQQLEQLAASYKTQAAALAAQQTVQLQQAEADLNVRNLTAAGDTAAAQIAAKLEADAKEMADAVTKWGADSQYVKDLAVTQKAEETALKTAASPATATTATAGLAAASYAQMDTTNSWLEKISGTDEALLDIARRGSSSLVDAVPAGPDAALPDLATIAGAAVSIRDWLGANGAALGGNMSMSVGTIAVDVGPFTFNEVAGDPASIAAAAQEGTSTAIDQALGKLRMNLRAAVGAPKTN